MKLKSCYISIRPFTAVLLQIMPLAALFVGTTLFSLHIGAAAAILFSSILMIIQFIKDKSILFFPLFSSLISILFVTIAFITEETFFIKIQTSLFNSIFALLLLMGWSRNYPIMKLFFGKQFSLNHDTWMQLSFRWSLFFSCLAIANEFAWRMLDDEGWVNVKVFIFAPATALFMASLIPLTVKGKIPKQD